MNNCQLVPQSGQYRVLIGGQEIGRVQPGAQLNHYGIVLKIQNTVISYSVVCPDSSICPTDIVGDLLDGLRKNKTEHSVISQGLFEAVVVNNAVVLKCGGIAICGLWLHEIDGIEMCLREQPGISYWVDILHSSIDRNSQLAIVLQDAINLRYIFGKLAQKSKKS